MRAWFISSVVIVIAGCSEREPRPPTVTGTLLCDVGVRLSVNAAVPDDVANTAALQREVVARVTSEAFVHRVAVDERFDETVIAGALSARPVKDSRLVEIGVALDDRVLATRVCNALLDHYVAERLGGDRLAMSRDNVRVLDHCRPPRSKH